MMSLPEARLTERAAGVRTTAAWVGFALIGWCVCTVWAAEQAPAGAIGKDLRGSPGRIPPGAPRRTVDTIADMVKLKDLAPSVYIIVRGYHQPNDDGGGAFRYDAGSRTEPDRGVVFRPANGRGRFVRVFDPDGPVYAEWFGAYGDAKHDDQAAINACLERFGRVKPLAKTYGVRGKPTHFNPEASYHAIDVGPGYRIEGSGRATTTIKLLDGANPRGVTTGDNYFSVIANRNFYESADYVIIRDLTIDGNFDGQNKHTTIQCISIRGTERWSSASTCEAMARAGTRKPDERASVLSCIKHWFTRRATRVGRPPFTVSWISPLLGITATCAATWPRSRA